MNLFRYLRTEVCVQAVDLSRSMQRRNTCFSWMRMIVPCLILLKSYIKRLSLMTS